MARPKGVGDYSEEFKREAVARARETSFSAAAMELGCGRRTLFVWAKAYPLAGRVIEMLPVSPELVSFAAFRDHVLRQIAKAFGVRR